MSGRRYCDNCGSTIASASRFCTHCGMKLVEETVPDARDASGPEPSAHAETRMLDRPEARDTNETNWLGLPERPVSPDDRRVGETRAMPPDPSEGMVRFERRRPGAQFMDGLKRVAGEARRQSQVSYEEFSTYYRGWAHNQRERLARDRVLKRFRALQWFFHEAQRETNHYLDWRLQYRRGDEPDEASGRAFEGHLREAYLRARAAHLALEGVEGTFARLVETDHLEEAWTIVRVVREGQDAFLCQPRAGRAQIAEPVLEPLFLALQRLQAVEGWVRYKDEFHRTVQGLLGRLDSSVLTAALAAERRRLERFPNPHQGMQSQYTPGGSSRAALDLSFVLFNEQRRA